MPTKECHKPNPCGTPTGNCMCYGSNEAGALDYSYVNSDNETEGSFSMNTTTIKWSVGGGDGSLDGSIPYIDDCINNGGIATMRIVDQDDNVVIFEADTIISSSATGAAYGGTGPGGFSGKTKEVTISCSLNEGGNSGKACSFLQDDKSIKWFDSKTGVELTEEECESLVECTVPVLLEPVCEENIIQLLACSTEATAEVAIDDQILTIARQDCEGVILSSVQYNVTQGNAELTEAVNTTDCDPDPDITQTEECIVDSEGVEWTEITIITGATVNVVYVNQDSLELGSPAGSPKEWTSCVSRLCDPPTNDLCYYIEKEAAIRPFGDPPDFTGLQAQNSFAGATLDGFICGTWETTTPTFGSAPLRFPPGLTNWFVSMFNSGSGIYNNSMRLNMWAKSGCILESYIRMTDIDSPNGANEGEVYNVSGLSGQTALTEYTFTGSPAYYPFGTYTPVTFGTQGSLQPNGDYLPNNTTSGAGLQAIYNGAFSNQIVTGRTDQGGQSVVWMFVKYLAPVRAEIDCETGEVTYWDDFSYDEQNPYDAAGQPILTSVEVPSGSVVVRPCCNPDVAPQNGPFSPYSDCDVESSMVIRCVDGTQTVQDIDGNDITLNDGDEITYNTLTCDGIVIGFSIVSVNDSTVQIALPAPGGPTDPDPAPFNTVACSPEPEIIGPACKVDENGNVWQEYSVVSTVSGTTFIYINEKGGTGTPSGSLEDCPLEECGDVEIVCYCVQSKGSVKSVKEATTKSLSKVAVRVKESETKPGKVLDICEERLYDCQGNYVSSTYLYQGKQFDQATFDKQGLTVVSCDAPDVTYSPGAVTCAVEDRIIDGVSIQVVLNCTEFSNDSDPTDLFTQYTLADDYTTEGLGGIGDIYLPNSEPDVTGCPCEPNCIVETKECFAAVAAIKGVANAGDTVCVLSITNQQSSTTVTTVTNSASGSELYNGDDPTGNGFDFGNAAVWTGPVTCDEEIVAPTCCPIIAEACACIAGEKVNIQYGIYPDTGADAGWYKRADTGELLAAEPAWVDCCGECV